MSIEPGVLYVVATPIGNLGDISQRALDVLGAADLVAAEDTRHSKALLGHFGLQRRLLSLHEHNEEARLDLLLSALRSGQSVALISDAGTPLISDPGYRLVREARRAGVPVRTVPGASSIIAALSVAGLPTDRFCFEGFLPARGEPRRRRLQELADEPRTLVFLESSHRIEAMVAEVARVFGAEREIAVCRELTKQFETVLWGEAAEIAEQVAADPLQRKGEFVVVVGGAAGHEEAEAVTVSAERMLAVLLRDLPLKKAVAAAVELTGLPRNRLYKMALEQR